MKKFLALMAAVFVIGCSGKGSSQSSMSIKAERTLSGYQNVLWGESGENTTKLLKENGYDLFAAYSNKEDRLFAGKVSDYNAAILCLFSQDKLYEVRVTILDQTADADYKKFIEALTEKYGKPEAPLYKNDTTPRWEFDNSCSISVYNLSDLTIIYNNNSFEPPKEKEKEVKTNDL